MHLWTDEYIEKIKSKLSRTKKNAFFIEQLGEDRDQKGLYNRSERMRDCCNLTVWDKYEKNYLLDLQKINRCKDRFCPNCRTVALSLALHRFNQPFQNMLEKGYYPFMATFTVPNCHKDDLQGTIKKMNKAFLKLNRWLSKDTKEGFKKRLFKVPAIVKALEITQQKSNSDYYHPHFHCIFFLDTYDENLFQKYLPDGIHRKTGKTLYLSDADIFLSKLWTFAFDGISVRKWEQLPDSIEYLEDRKRNYYMCDIREMEMPGGLYEVFKYCFKDDDIKTKEHMRVLLDCVTGARLRQTYGELYNLDIDSEDDMEKDLCDSIENYLEIKETPESVMCKTMRELGEKYSEYVKISRFKGSEHIQNLE